MVSISARHAEDPGSIPGGGGFLEWGEMRRVREGTFLIFELNFVFFWGGAVARVFGTFPIWLFCFFWFFGFVFSIYLKTKQRIHKNQNKPKKTKKQNSQIGEMPKTPAKTKQNKKNKLLTNHGLLQKSEKAADHGLLKFWCFLVFWAFARGFGISPIWLFWFFLFFWFCFFQFI